MKTGLNDNVPNSVVKTNPNCHIFKKEGDVYSCSIEGC